MPDPRAYPTFRNWGGNFLCRPAERHTPDSVEAVQQIVRSAAAAGRLVRPVGSGYSYTRLVQTDEVMLSLDRWTGVESLDRDAGVACVRAGTSLEVLERELAAQGFAMENLGDINKQTIAGAIGTGTHGTGITLGNVSTRIAAMELVLADGSLRRLTPEDGDEFSAAAVSLGLLGIMVRVWLKVLPMYWLAIDRRRRTFESVLTELPGLVANNRNYEFFWFPDSELVYEKTMNVVAKPAGGGSGRTVGRWVNDIVNENFAMWVVCTINHTWPSSRKKLLDLGSSLVPQGSVVTRADAAYATERLVVHHETEWAVPVERVVPVLQQLHELWRRFPTRTVFPIEVRFTRRDELMLSPSYGRDVAWIAVHTWWKEDYEEYFDAVSAIFAAADGRPHWGKLHSLGAQDFQRLYPKACDFDRVRRRLDPNGLFQNHYLKRLLPVALA